MSDWRYFEPSREAIEEANAFIEAEQRALEPRSCNRHRDCDAATADYMARHKLTHKWEMPAGFHCHDDDCEDCFGC